MSHRRSRPHCILIESMEQRLMFDASQLSEAIVSSTLPTSVANINIIKGKVAVSVTNTSGSIQKDKVHVVVVGTTDPALDVFSQADKQLGVVTTRISLTSGQTKTFNVNVNLKKGALADADYTVYAVVLDDAQTHSQSLAGSTLLVRPPIVQLAETESFAKLPASILPGAKFNITDKITITNTGSDPSTEPLNIAVFATPDAIPADGTMINTEQKKLTLKPNKTSRVQFRLPTFPSLAPGTYRLITQVTTTDGTITTTDPATAPTIIVATA